MIGAQTCKRALLAIVPFLAFSAPPALTQDIDAMAKWTALTVVHYRVVGEFSGVARIFSFAKQIPVSDSASVTDRVEIEFDWNQNEMTVVGTPVFRNFPSTTGAVTPLPGCPNTKVEGLFEFASIVAVKSVPYQGLGMTIRRDRPAGAVPHPAPETGSAPCGHAWDQIAPKSETYDSGLGLVPPAMALAMPGVVPISPDGKSLIVKGEEGWTWTFTPTPVK